MVSTKEIRQLAVSVAERFRPERIVLFGSYACGQPTRDSDVDLLVVMSHRGRAHRMAARIRAACDVHFPLDILVRSSAELRTRLRMQDPFFRSIVNQGVVLHEAAHG